MGDIIVCGNLIKWSMITPEHYDTKLVSKSFKIRNRTCKFNYDSGSETCLSTSSYPRPVQSARFSVDFDVKRSFTPSVPVTIIVSTSRKAFNPDRCYVTGENNQIIWSKCSASDLLSTSMTLEMVIHVLKGKLKKYFTSNVSPF